MSADLSLYLVTGDTHGRPLPGLVAEAVAGGATTVQIREKAASARELLALTLAVADRLAAFPHATLLVNDRVDVAAAAARAGAAVHGVHVGQSDLPATAARALLVAAGLPSPVVGVSAATPDELRAAAREEAADYVGIGAVHPTATKPDAPAAIGHDGFARLAALTPLPAVAIGGVTARDAVPLRQAGAAGIAVVSAVCAAPDPRAAARELRIAFDRAAHGTAAGEPA